MLFYTEACRGTMCIAKGSNVARACTHCSLRAFACGSARSLQALLHGSASRGRPASSHSRSQELDTYSSKTQSQRRTPSPDTSRA